MTTSTVPTRPAIHPACRFWTPSSRSIIASARSRAAPVSSADDGGSRAMSSLNGGFPLLELDALLGEVLDRRGVPRDRGGLGLLVLELDVLRFLVDADQVVAMLEDRLHDLVR